ncbi:ZZ-type zinc finger-containing protein 3 [Osmerus mordax]|uniref:ZZ-type zinc finger-containing protein 3 n=1 Tax=Osmerus mordax TaxID=8014 RepID=UPI003510578D
MAASRSSRVTRSSSVGINGLDENFCGRTLRNRSIAQPEECSSSPLPRARSPKKKQDSQQASSQPAAQQGKVADSKASSAEGEPWASPRKRGLSCSERDPGAEKAENCERGKAGARDASPPLKRAKRCSRSGDSQGHDHDPQPPEPESPASAPAALKENNKEDLPSQNFATAASFSPDLGKEEEGKDDGCVECDGPARPQNTHKASNGLGENGDKDAQQDTPSEEPRLNPSPSVTSPTLLNGSQAGAPSSPEPIVPCRNSVPEQAEVSCSEEAPTVPLAPSQDPAPELLLVREPEVEVEEVEVDVVGDSLCVAHEEQVTEEESGGTNGRPLSPVQDPAPSAAANDSPIPNNNNSGETTPPLAPPACPSEPGCTPSVSCTPPSFTESHEHRYTLRTSPRRATCGGPRPPSPPRDNGPLLEEWGAGVQESMEVETSERLEEPAGPFGEQPASVDQGERAGGEGFAQVEGRGAGGSKEPACSQVAEEEDEEEEPDVYYFESDHLALKHNKDYQRLLQTIGVLEAQRAQAILDLEELARHQREALSEPVSFVEQLQKQVELGLPCPQRVVQLPDITWDQYTSGLGDFEREFCDKKRKTRRLKLIFDKVGLPVRPKSPLEPKKEGESSTMYSALPSSDAPENGTETQMIRGRLCHQSKPDTFNQLWTVEEQKKLEQLLLKFPPEEVESKRWQKIADDLGNRTAKQVASRVQKYFIKLTKAGIPVPGRTPNMCMYSKKASSKRQHHLNKHLYRQSTFLTSYEPPVYMDEEDEHTRFFNSLQDHSADDSDEETIPLEYRHLPEYKELLELKRQKKQKLQELQDDSALALHQGYKCDMCGMEPIQGVRWHCQDCPSDNAVDFCANCSDCLFKTETHKPSHHLEPVYTETFLDRDYCLPQSTGYNYLDPNYFPANR